MKLHLHHPKLLAISLWVIFLLAIAAVTTVGILLASSGDDEEITTTPIPRTSPLVSGSLEGGDNKETTFTPIQQIGTPLPTVSDEELVEALRVARTSGVIEEINGGQEWSHDPVYVYVRRLGGVEAVTFHAIWENPVESSGPWVLIWCQGTRKLTTYARWTNITRLAVTVDIENDEVVTYAPMGHDGIEPVLEVGSHGDREAKVHDVASGDLLFKGTNDELSGFKLFGVKLFGFRMCAPGKKDEVGK